MAKNIKPEDPIVDLSTSLGQLGETTTAAELVRTKGQSKKVRIISEKKLMEWILSLLQEHMAGKADAFSDQEKEELLKKTQDELAKRIAREQTAEAERDRIKTDLERALSTLSNSKASQGDLDQALAALKAKLAETEQINQDLQQDNYDLHDQLNEKMAMVSTTIAEKDRLKETVKYQMLRSNALVEGVLDLDTQLYGSRHQEENPVDESAGEEFGFYHDFEVGTKIVATLWNDLQRLRSIAQSSSTSTAAPLLESDLKLLEELKAGSLSATDVAAPVAALIEAMEGARHEATLLADAGVQALGDANTAHGREQTIAELPDAEENPAPVAIAATTAVVRDLAASLAHTRQQLNAVSQMSLQADEARDSAEGESAAATKALGDIKHALEAALRRENLLAEQVRNLAGALATRSADQASSQQQLLGSRLKRLDAALTGHGEDLAPAEAAKEVVDALHEEVVNAPSAAEVNGLAAHIQALARTRAQAGEANAPVLSGHIAHLETSLAGAPTHAVIAAATQVLTALHADAIQAPSTADLGRATAERDKLNTLLTQSQSRINTLEADLTALRSTLAGVQARSEARKRSEQALAQVFVQAAQGDHELADASADLALAVENSTADGHPDEEDLTPHLDHALGLLARRKQELAEQAQRLRSEIDAAQTMAQEAQARTVSLQAERNQLSQAQAPLKQRVQELEQALARTGADAAALRTQLGEANQNRNSLQGERNSIMEQLDQATLRTTELTAALAQAREELNTTQALNQQQVSASRTLAHEVVSALGADADLADATTALAISLENSADGQHIADQKTIGERTASAVAQLAKRKQELANELENTKRDGDALRWQLKEAHERIKDVGGERDEMAASGKEVINLLTQQRERANQELEALRQEHHTTEDLLTRFEHRVSSAENANRQLAEALSMLAAQEKDQTGVEDKRLDLELALSQLPGEGEDSVTIPEDLSLQLAASGTKLAEALLSRRQAMTSSFAKAQRDQDSVKQQVSQLKGEIAAARTALEEQDATLRSSQVELSAVRTELAKQGSEFATKVQELATARGEMASLRAELTVSSQRLEDHERRLQQSTAHLAEARQDNERLQADLSEHQQRLLTSGQAQSQLILALRALTNHHDASPTVARALTEADFSDPLSKAALKLDLAQAAGPEQVAIASQAYVTCLRDRLQHLVSGHETVKDQLSAAKREADDKAHDLAAANAALVDREHQISNLTTSLETARHNQNELTNEILQQRRAHEGVDAQVRQVHEQLRQAQAELADLQARDGASSSHFSNDNDRLRHEREEERRLRERIETERGELVERIGSGEARLKALREEFTRRLAERDAIVQQKDRQLDALASERGDAKGLQAQLGAISTELASAKDRIRELEDIHGAHAGATSKSGDLARELRNLQAERDQLRDKQRAIEAEHTDAVSLAAQLSTQLEEKRKEIAAVREKQSQELAEERERTQTLREEFRKLKEEVTGLRARLRRLSEPGSTSGANPTIKDR